MHAVSLLLEQPAFWIQVAMHLGSTNGQPASGGGDLGGLTAELVEELVTPPVGFFGTHWPFCISWSPLHTDTDEVDARGVLVPGTVEPPVGLHTPPSMLDPEPHDVVEVVTPPVGLHTLPSIVDPEAHDVTGVVVVIGAVGVDGVVEMAVHWQNPLLKKDPSPQAEVLPSGVVSEPVPPVTDFEIHELKLMSMVEPSPQEVTVEVTGVVLVNGAEVVFGPHPP